MIKRRDINMIWLDDTREPGEPGWTKVKTAKEAIEHLEMRDVYIVDLDHDLGLKEDEDGHEETGYDVLLWIEEQVMTDPTYVQPIMRVHSENPVAVEKMKATIKKINEVTQSRRSDTPR